MSWAAVIAGGAAILGSVMQSQSAKDAGKKGAAGAQAGIDEQRRQFDLILSMLAPQRQVGYNSLNTLNRLYGYGNLPAPNALGGPTTTATGGKSGGGASFDPITGQANLGSSDWSPSVNFNPLSPTNLIAPGGLPLPKGLSDTVNDFTFGLFGKKKKKPKPASSPKPDPAAQAAAYNQQFMPTQQAQGAPDMSVFFTSPDYNFRRDEGMRNIENSFAARGGAASGNALRALTDFNSNLASGEFGNFVNRQLAMAGLGQTATNQGVNAAMYTGGNVANLLGQQGNARASGIINQTNAWTNGLNDLAGIYGAWMRNKQLGAS